MTSSKSQVYPVIWHNNSVSLIDQTRLPNEFCFVEIHNSEDMSQAIKTMIVRGAPAIGVAAAYGMYLGARDIETSDRLLFLAKLEKSGPDVACDPSHGGKFILGDRPDDENRDGNSRYSSGNQKDSL